MRLILLMLCGALTVASCAASNSGDDGNAPETGPPDATPDATQADAPGDSTAAPDCTASGHDAAPDSTWPAEASLSDVEAGAGDDASDASDEPAPVGTVCSPVNSTQSQACGGCGTQDCVCLPDDGGVPVWQAWGACLNEVPDACSPPGAIAFGGPCGRCGTQLSVCQVTTCTWAAQPCNDAPDAACYPGSESFAVGLSCDAGGRWSTCQSDCSWGTYGACSLLDGGTLSSDHLIVPSKAGAKTSGTFMLNGTAPIPMVADFTCPTTFGPATPYGYVQLLNNTAQSAVVSAWHAQATGGANLASVGTVMATYVSSLPPLAGDDEGRAACAAVDQGPCFDSTTDTAACQASFAGLMIGDGNQFTVPAHSWVWIDSASLVAGTGGPYVLTVLTNSLQ